MSCVYVPRRGSYAPGHRIGRWRGGENGCRGGLTIKRPVGRFIVKHRKTVRATGMRKTDSDMWLCLNKAGMLLH